MLGCAGSPPPAPPPPLPGTPPTVVAWSVIRPDALGAALDAFEARLGPDAADALGPAGAAWARMRADLTDRLTDLAPAVDDPDPWVGWGLDRRDPIRVALTAGDGMSLARALAGTLRAVDGGDASALIASRAGLSEAAVWRLRIVARVGDPERLLAGLERLSGRLGLAVLPRGPGRWRARDAETGLWLWLREAGPYAVLDLARPALPGGQPPPPALGGKGWPEAPAAPLVVGLTPAALSVLDAGVGASRAFTATMDLEIGDAHRIWIASADVISHCTGIWRAGASRARAIMLGLAAPEGRPRVLGEAQLTDLGAAAWQSARRSMPVSSLTELPAALRIGLAPTDFFGRSRFDGPQWLRQAALCPAGHSIAIGAAALGVLPGLATAEMVPGPTPPDGWGAPPQGLASAIVGATAVAGEAVPILASAVAVERDLPLPTAPFGPEIAAVPGTGVWVRAGPVPAAFGVHRPGERQLRIFGLGDGAHAALARRLIAAPGAVDDPEAPAIVVEAHLDPHRLAEALASAGERGAGVAALRALGDRFGRWQLRVVHQDKTVRLAAESAPPTPGAELDRRHPSQ